jgi:hypothetical protein
MDQTKAAFAIAIAIIAVAGCAGGAADEAEDLDAPTVLAVTTTEVSVGDNVEIVGGNFVSGAARHTEIQLVGDYHTDGGATHPVDMRFRPHWEDGNRLTWAYFGPFDVPFSPTGDELGTFVGELVAINVEPETGVELYSEPLDMELTVGPSIIITDLQPVGAQCSNRPNVILGGFEYAISVEAIGFDPINFSFVIAGEPTSQAPRIYRQAAVGRAAEFGIDGQFAFERVPAELPFYLATIGVSSLDSKNKQHILSLDFGVHNPVEYVNLNQVKIAEIEAATPVSGCIAGGETNGRTVTYTESETETRSRTVGVNWNQEWFEEHSQSNGGSTSETNSISTTVSESTTEGATWGWEDGRDISGGGNAGGSLFGVVEVGVSGEYKDIHREHASWNRSNTRGYTVGRNYSRTDTETWAFGRTQGYSLSTGGSDFWTVSSESSTIVSFEGFILPGEFGVFYRQTTRMAIPGAIVAYNLCGEPEVVAETNFYDYNWSVDLAQGAECPPLPKSSLPEAQCLIAPCN